MPLIQAPHYSIWWMPKGTLKDDLQRIITTLGREFDSERFQAETFAPHITLVQDIVPGKHIQGSVTDLVRLVKTFATNLRQPTPLKLVEISKSNTFFQCVFARAEMNEVVTQTVENARKLFRPDLVKTKAVFMPHLSLLYGDHTQEVRDQAIIRARTLLSLPQEFEGNSLSLWTSGEPTREWQMVAENTIG